MSQSLSIRFVRQHLKMRHLIVLRMVDETLNITHAAERLNLSQAAVSRSLSELEEGLGGKIFKRTHKGLTRTHRGQEVMAEVRQLFEGLDRLALAAEGHRHGLMGRLTIGFQTVTLRDQLLETIVSFKEDAPLVRLRLIDGILSQLVSELREGRLDFVFGALDPDLIQDDLEGRHMLTASAGIWCKDQALRDQPPALEDIIDRPWLLPARGTPMRNRFNNMLQSQGLNAPDDIIELNNSSFIAALCADGRRLAVCPDSYGMRELSRQGFFRLPLDMDGHGDRMGLIMRRGDSASAASMRYLEHVAPFFSDEFQR